MCRLYNFGWLCSLYQTSMALGYVPTEFSKDDTTLDVEINGKFYAAHVTDKPLYDANGGKMKS